MKKNKKIALVLVFAFLIVGLAGCSSGNVTEPITKDTFFVIKWFGWLYNFLAIDNKFGWGIIFATIIIRTCAWPVYAKSNDMTVKMQLMQPEMNKINLKYATRKDPDSQQKMQMEMMGLYKKYKINPLGCILMQVLQMFLFTMTWQVVSRIPVRGEGVLYTLDSDFLFLDLSKGGSFTDFSWILAALVGITMVIQQIIAQKKPKYQKNIPTPQVGNQGSMQNSMKIMMYFMVFMMVTVAWGNNALALYWIVGNIFSLFQMLISRQLSAKKYEKMKNII